MPETTRPKNPYRCNDCGWEGEETSSRMVENPHDPDDKSLCEVEACPECGSTSISV